MEIRQVRAFLAVVDTGTFAAAAESLCLAQSSVSEQVARLERQLGVDLLDRSRRRVRLTARGEAFVPAARQLLVAHQRARDAAIGDQIPVWRLALPQGRRTDAHRASAALRTQARPRELEVVDLAAPQRVAAVISGQVDAAIVHGPPGDLGPTLVSYPLPAERLVPTVGRDHPLASQADPVTAEQLATFPLVIDAAARTSAPFAALVVALGDDLASAAQTSRSAPLTTVAADATRWTFLYESVAETTDLAALGVVALQLSPAIHVEATLLGRAGDPDVAAVAAALAAT